MIDIVSQRYGWSFKMITTEMYWEDFYDMYEHAYNMKMVELNDANHFQFILHIHSKEDANAWQDSPVPFPDRNWIPKKQRKRKAQKFADKSSRKKASPEQIARAKEVRKRLRQHQKDLANL